jgi:hypothetical protein
LLVTYNDLNQKVRTKSTPDRNELREQLIKIFALGNADFRYAQPGMKKIGLKMTDGTLPDWTGLASNP